MRRALAWLSLVALIGCSGTFVPFFAVSPERDISLDGDGHALHSRDGKLGVGGFVGALYVPENLADGHEERLARARDAKNRAEMRADNLASQPEDRSLLDRAEDALPDDPSDWWYAIPLAAAFALGYWAWKDFPGLNTNRSEDA
jgi:hypothetical protein